jgi:hypothetical protein
MVEEALQFLLHSLAANLCQYIGVFTPWLCLQAVL